MPAWYFITITSTNFLYEVSFIMFNYIATGMDIGPSVWKHINIYHSSFIFVRNLKRMPVSLKWTSLYELSHCSPKFYAGVESVAGGPICADATPDRIQPLSRQNHSGTNSSSSLRCVPVRKSRRIRGTTCPERKLSVPEQQTPGSKVCLPTKV